MIGFLVSRKINLAFNNISKNINVINAPTGSINDKTPFIIPKELPIKNPIKKIIANKEYLLQGFAAQLANLYKILLEDLYKNVFCILSLIIENKKITSDFSIDHLLTLI